LCVGKPAPSRQQDHYIANPNRPDAPVSRLWLESTMRDVYTKLGIIEPVVDVKGFTPMFIKTKYEYIAWDVQKVHMVEKGRDWWESDMLSLEDIRVLVELKRQKLIEHYKNRVRST